MIFRYAADVMRYRKRDIARQASALETTLQLEDDALSVRVANTTVWSLSREHIRRITHDRNGVVTLYREEVGQVFRIRLRSLERGALFWQQLQTWRQAELVPPGTFDAAESIGMMVGGAGATVAVLGVFHEMPWSAVLVGLLAIGLIVFLSRAAWRWRYERPAAHWVLWTAAFLALLVVARVIQVTASVS